MEGAGLLCGNVSPVFIAKTALYSRHRGYMKDLPALLCAILAVRDRELCEDIFPSVIDNGKMLRNFVQIIRSGNVGRRSFGSAIRRLIREWFDARTPETIFKQSVGSTPSFGDIIKLVHPRAEESQRNNLYRYLLGREMNLEELPAIVQKYEAFKETLEGEAPPVPFQFLTSLPLKKDHWKSIAANAGWQMTRMNLNTFERHGVFEDGEMVELIAARLRSAEEIRRAKVFPYQLLAAYKTSGNSMPFDIRKALVEAMEIAVSNVPRIDGRVVVLPDVSGSMSSPITGHRGGSSSTVQCVDVAALVASAFLRLNDDVRIIPFETSVVNLTLEKEAGIMSNSNRLSSIRGGGTDCSAPLSYMNERDIKADLVVFISDNESWIDRRGSRRVTKVMEEWRRFKRNNPSAKLVCIDIQPNLTTQAIGDADVLNIGGFSDNVFDLLKGFAEGSLCADALVSAINEVELPRDRVA